MGPAQGHQLFPPAGYRHVQGQGSETFQPLDSSVHATDDCKCSPFVVTWSWVSQVISFVQNYWTCVKKMFTILDGARMMLDYPLVCWQRALLKCVTKTSNKQTGEYFSSSMDHYSIPGVLMLESLQRESSKTFSWEELGNLIHSFTLSQLFCRHNIHINMPQINNISLCRLSGEGTSTKEKRTLNLK